MARRLCHAGFSVTVWNRTPKKVERLKVCGARVAPTARLAVANAPVISAMLANKQASEQVFFEQGVVAAMAAGSLLIDMATMAPDEAVQLADAVTGQGKRFVEAPVSGGESGARDGTLSIMAGGSASDIAEARPVLAPLGSITRRLFDGMIAAGRGDQAISGIIAELVEHASD